MVTRKTLANVKAKGRPPGLSIEPLIAWIDKHFQGFTNKEKAQKLGLNGETTLNSWTSKGRASREELQKLRDRISERKDSLWGELTAILSEILGPSVASEMNSLLDEAERWVAETPFEQFLLNQKATVEILEANLVELERKLVSDEAMHNAWRQSILRQQACELIAWIREPECGSVHQSAHELGEVAQKLRQADETLEQLRQLEPVHQRFRALKHAVATRIRSRFGGVIESEHVPCALIKKDDGTVRWVQIG